MRILTEQLGSETFVAWTAAILQPSTVRFAQLADLETAVAELMRVAWRTVGRILETIHPFVDGNGRTGRALIHVILRRRGLAGHVLPPVSLVLAT
jgi:fido (protein-threonine AMPylation protein)